ncbi:hypothetical protein E2C01_057472 [Portunus trituberculatus]|uniref:Uncharacterized protein n=1 Tax=Portunus trituberculatus TaxID=210409 RepID=A0A5B7H3F6_PORTR|nr:hypothetical protein [Portunus trituberculatus]
MAYNYEFNAPKFCDFSKGDIEVDESYFVPESSSKTTISEAASPFAVSLPAPRSVLKRKSRALSGLDTVGVRQSPRLAAIAKALRRNGTRRSFGKTGTGQQQNPKKGARKR